MNTAFIIVHALGAVQGLFLATVLASRRRGSVPNRILAAAMLTFAVDLGMAVYHATGTEVRFPHLIGIDYGLAFLYGPLLYLYARTLSHGEHDFRRIYLLHFLPFTIVTLAMVPFWAQSGAEKLQFLHAPEESGWTAPLTLVGHLKLVSAVIYIGAILPLLRRHRRRLRDTLSSTERVNLLWLRNLIYGIVALTTFAVVLYLLSLRDDVPVIGLDPDTTYDDYMLLALAVFVYAIGYFGLRQPEVFDARLHGEPATSVGLNHDKEPDAPRYARSGMDTATAERYEQELRALMDREKPYRRGDLTLQELSDLSGIAPHHLTEVLNTRVGQNFYDFVNGYRVREVQQRLLDPNSENLTLLAIGMDAGFNSKSSFNLVFKKHTGMTPSEYRSRAASGIVSAKERSIAH